MSKLSFYTFVLIQSWKIIKQWPLAGEFVEFEYSPKIRQFGELLAKMAILASLAGLDTFARHSPTTFPGLDTFAKGKFTRI